MSYRKRGAQSGVPAEVHLGTEREDAVANPNPGNPYVDQHLARVRQTIDAFSPLAGFGDGGDIPGILNRPAPYANDPPAR